MVLALSRKLFHPLLCSHPFLTLSRLELELVGHCISGNFVLLTKVFEERFFIQVAEKGTGKFIDGLFLLGSLSTALEIVLVQEFLSLLLLDCCLCLAEMAFQDLVK